MKKVTFDFRSTKFYYLSFRLKFLHSHLRNAKKRIRRVKGEDNAARTA